VCALTRNGFGIHPIIYRAARVLSVNSLINS
jgi:hypothetical protein